MHETSRDDLKDNKELHHQQQENARATRKHAIVTEKNKLEHQNEIAKVKHTKDTEMNKIKHQYHLEKIDEDDNHKKEITKKGHEHMIQKKKTFFGLVKQEKDKKHTSKLEEIKSHFDKKPVSNAHALNRKQIGYFH